MKKWKKKKCQKSRKNIEDYLTTFRQEEKEKIIYETFEYINEEGQPENLKRKTYEGQIMGLIVALRNLMPKWCTGCKDWYCVKKGDKPKLRCIMCNIGRHECDKNNESITGSGIIWICPECFEINMREGIIEKAKDQTIEVIVSRDNKRKRDEITVEAQVHTEEINASKLNKVNSAMRAQINAERNNKPNRNQDQTNNVEVIDLDEGIHIEDISDAPSRKDTSNINTIHRKPQKPCRFWQKGRCRFEDKCWYLHQEKCDEILTYGECHKSECRLLHPDMCRSMKEKGICDNGKYCYYAHQLYVKTRIHDSQRNEMQRQNFERMGNIGRGNNNQRVEYKFNQHIRPYNYQRSDNNRRENYEDSVRPERRSWDNNYQMNNKFRRENNGDFLRPENMKWEDMRTPMFRYAAEILAEKMMYL